MSQVKFLCDEQIANALVAALLQREPAIDVTHVGWSGSPPRGTKDPELLLAAETAERLLVSLDRSSMPRHVIDHLAAGHHTCGVVLLKSGFGWHVYVDNLILIWSASGAAEWVNQLEYIPW